MLAIKYPVFIIIIIIIIIIICKLLTYIQNYIHICRYVRNFASYKRLWKNTVSTNELQWTWKEFTLFTYCHTFSCVQSAPIRNCNFTNVYPQFLFAVFITVFRNRLFSISINNITVSKLLKSWSTTCAFAWKGKRRLVAERLFCRSCAQGVFFRVSLPLPNAGRPPHRPENEACCVWKNSAVKQPYVRSTPFKTKRFIEAIKKARRSKHLCTLALLWIFWT